MFDEIILQWQKHLGITNPSPEPVVLWRDGSRCIGISNKWGPAVPYGPVDHRNGQQNYGYMRVKGDLEAVRSIPETQDWPELQELLIAINSAESPIESVGCEKAFFPVQGAGQIVVKLGSYIDLIFTELALNESPENLLFLASRLLESVKDCHRWWGSIEIELQPHRGIYGAAGAQWGLLLRTINYGQNEEAARRFWEETTKRLGNAISQLPKDFRCPTTTPKNGVK